MERKDSKERVNLKLSFLDLFPSYEEIDENNEGIIISFQNMDLSYNLTELIKNREELFIPQQIPSQTIKFILIKSNNPYATGPFTVKSGEQWVTFTYDHKKKQTSNFALSLIDCIKIKFLCKMDYVPALTTINNQLTNTEIQTKNDSILANIIAKPSPKKLYSNFTTKKKNSYNNNMGNMVEHDSLHTEESKISKILDNITPEIKSSNTNNNNLNNTTLNSSKNTNNPLLKSENLGEFNPLSSSTGVIGKELKNKEKNKNVKKVYNNNLNTNNSLNIETKKSNNDIGPSSTQKKKNNNNKNNENFHKEKTKMGNNSLNNITNTIDNKNINENNKSKQNLKRNKSKNLMDSKNKTNKKEKQTKSVTNNINLNNTNNSTNNNNNTQKKINKESSAKNMNETKKKEEKNDNKESNINIINNNNENNNEDNINNNILENNNNNYDMNITNKQVNDNNYENIEKNNDPLLDDYNDELDNFGLDNFSKKLEDFQLLYSDEYIKSIKEEDYSLEIELYIEKFIELITEYHIQIEEKDIEYQLVKNMYQQNISQYLEINKLYKKLQMLKDDYDLKKNNPKPINDEHDKNYINNLITNKVEINMFKFLLFSQKDKEAKEKREEIKKILKTLLNKPKHKNIINQNEKIQKWVQINMEKPNVAKDKGKKKGKQEKIPPTDSKNKGGNKNDKNDKKKKNTSNSPSKSKNKFNKNTQEEKGKKK